MTPVKEHNGFPVPCATEMEIYKWHDKKLKIIVLRKPRDLHKNADSQLNEIKETISE